MAGCTWSGKRFKSLSRINTAYGVKSVQECAMMCTATTCKGVSYSAGNKMCELFSTRDQGDFVTDGSFVSVSTACLGKPISLYMKFEHFTMILEPPESESQNSGIG